MLGGAEVEEREPYRADSRAEIERGARGSSAPHGPVCERSCREGSEEHGVDVHAIAAAPPGLSERDATTEESVVRGASALPGERGPRYFCHGRRPRKLNAVTDPGNVCTTCVPSSTV